MKFPVDSRYHQIPRKTWRDSNEREVVYLGRRFVPSIKPSDIDLEHAVTQDERLDNITFKYMSDPTQFWQLCDANNALHPLELTNTIGRRLRIPVLGGF